MARPGIETQKRPQSIIGFSLLLKLVESYGHSPLPLLESAGIAPELLKDPKAKITLQQDLAFVRAMLELIDDPLLGFHAGQCYRLSAFGNLGMAAASSDTVEDAIEFFLKFIQLSYTHFDVSFIKTDEKAVLRFKDQYDLKELRQFYLERDFSFVLISTRDLFPHALENQNPKAIHFDYEAPTAMLSAEQEPSAAQEKYESLFGCAVHFSMAHNEIQFDRSYLSQALPQANPLTRQLLEEHCETQEVEIVGPAGYAQTIRQLIRNSEEVMPNLEDVAQQLHKTSRTVRRKLQAEGYNFQGLFVEEMSRKSIHYLETTQLTVEQIAQRLGYSESASFIHAFKRWTGKVPKAFRS